MVSAMGKRSAKIWALAQREAQQHQLRARCLLAQGVPPDVLVLLVIDTPQPVVCLCLLALGAALRGQE